MILVRIHSLVVIPVIKHLNIGFLNVQYLITVVPNIFVLLILLLIILNQNINVNLLNDNSNYNSNSNVENRTENSINNSSDNNIIDLDNNRNLGNNN